MGGCLPGARLTGPAKKDIHFFQRSEESRERAVQFRRQPPGGAKIAGAELIGDGNDGRAHRPILMRALRPGEATGPIDPNSETHSLLFTSTVGCGWASADGGIGRLLFRIKPAIIGGVV